MNKLTITMIAVWSLIGLSVLTILVMGLSGSPIFGFTWSAGGFIPGNTAELYRESFPASEIDSISFSAGLGSVTVRHSRDNNITIVQTASENIPEGMRLSASLSGGTLTVGHQNRSVNIRGTGNLRNDMEIFIPQSYTGDANLRLSTGQLSLEDAWEFGTLGLNVSLGELSAKSELRARSATCTVSTGSLNLHTLHADNFSLKNSLGDIVIRNLHGSGTVVNSTGSIRLSGVEIADSLEVTNSLGDVSISLRGEPSLNFDGRTSLGDISTYFAGSSGGASARITTTVGEPPYKSLTVRNSTGGVTVSRAG
jgi:hypothetical protein